MSWVADWDAVWYTTCTHFVALLPSMFPLSMLPSILCTATCCVRHHVFATCDSLTDNSVSYRRCV